MLNDDDDNDDTGEMFSVVLVLHQASGGTSTTNLMHIIFTSTLAVSRRQDADRPDLHATRLPFCLRLFLRPSTGTIAKNKGNRFADTRE